MFKWPLLQSIWRCAFLHRIVCAMHYAFLQRAHFIWKMLLVSVWLFCCVSPFDFRCLTENLGDSRALVHYSCSVECTPFLISHKVRCILTWLLKIAHNSKHLLAFCFAPDFHFATWLRKCSFAIYHLTYASLLVFASHKGSATFELYFCMCRSLLVKKQQHIGIWIGYIRKTL